METENKRHMSSQKNDRENRREKNWSKVKVRENMRKGKKEKEQERDRGGEDKELTECEEGRAREGR